MAQSDVKNTFDFLIADLAHFGESLWRNEDVGEKRFNFFIAIITAVISGLIALHTQGSTGVDPTTLKNITAGVLIGLLIFGLLTYLRILKRNRVADEYQRTLKYIRLQLLQLPSVADVPKYKVPRKEDSGIWDWFRGGLAETVGAINAIIFSGLLIVISVEMVWASIAGAIVLMIAWVIAVPRKGTK
jgi:hypothetical protein